MFPSVDFVGNWRRWFAISAVLLAIGLLAIAIGRLDLGIDFQGGAQFTATDAERQLDEDEVTAALPPGIAEESVATTLGNNGYEVRTPVLSDAESEEVENALSEALGAEVSATSVSPAFGEQVRNQALQAVVAGVAILVAFFSGD